MSIGKIIKGIGGFYYVESTEDKYVYECKARGSFRNQKVTPLVGDNVEFSVNENAENTIDKILPRNNELVRPPLSNLDQLFIICSVVDPKINTPIVDKLIAIAEYKNIQPIIVITKCDLDKSYKDYVEIYKNAGYKTIVCDNTKGVGASEVSELLKDKISAFTGNTGVGKSSLLNAICPELNIQTGETSKKLGRGKHTTRHSQLYKVNGGYIADTPGFSSLDFEKCQRIQKDDLQYCFKEFQEYIGSCKFTTCSHINDKGCAICKAVEEGKISKSRHDSYVQMYNDVKDIKEWELK